MVLLPKKKIESIEFRPTLDVVENAIGSWDASLDRNGTVIASYIDSDKNGLYELYIGGVGEVLAPSNSQYLFNEFINVKKIDFSNCFKTDDVTSMYRMFRNCSSLLELDLSNFNTSKVTNMNAVFNNCKKIMNLDVSSFDTSNVTNMYFMLHNCRSLTNLDLSSFNFTNVTNSSNMFFNAPNQSLIYVKDDASKEFILGVRSDLSNVQIKES